MRSNVVNGRHSRSKRQRSCPPDREDGGDRETKCMLYSMMMQHPPLPSLCPSSPNVRKTIAPAASSWQGRYGAELQYLSHVEMTQGSSQYRWIVFLRLLPTSKDVERSIASGQTQATNTRVGLAYGNSPCRHSGELLTVPSKKALIALVRISRQFLRARKERHFRILILTLKPTR